MLQDVIDLRNARWIPRRQDVNPKTIDQIQKEAHEEHLNIQVCKNASLLGQHYIIIHHMFGRQ